MREDKSIKKQSKKRAAIAGTLAVVIGAIIALGVISEMQEYGEKSGNGLKKGAVQEKGEEVSSKEAVLLPESDSGIKKIPAGDRKKMTRLAIVRENVVLFEIKKEPSENQVDFEEWYITEPYSYKQLVNVSDLYDFLDHYASWDCIDEAKGVEFRGSGLYVEEEFEDTGACRFEIGQQNKEGNYYVKADYSPKIYEVEKKQVEVMTGLEAEDFMMGIANLIYLTTVEKLEVRTEGIAAVFDIETAADNSQIYKRDGSVCNEKGFKEMYAALLSVVIAGEAEEIHTQKAREPILGLHFYRNEKELEEVEINYYSYDDNYCLIERNGVREFLTERKALEQVIATIKEYCSH